MLAALAAGLVLNAAPMGEIAYMRSGKVWLVNADGSGRRKIADGSYDRPLVWSPNGDKLIYWKEEPSWNLFSWDYRSGRVTNLTRNRTQDNRAASFSRDGSKIAFMSGQKGLCIMNADGSGLRVLSERGHRDEPPQWVSDSVIAFLDTPDGKWRMLYFDLDKGELTHGPAAFYARSHGDEHFAYILSSEPTKIRRGSFLQDVWNVLDLGGIRILNFEWAPDRSMLVKTLKPAERLYWLSQTGQRRFLMDLRKDGWHGVSPSPDSRFAALSNGKRGIESIYVIPRAGGKPRDIAKGVWPAWRPKG